MTTKQIKVYPYTVGKGAIYPLSSRSEYECANSEITRGLTGSPANLEACFSSFPQIQSIAYSLGITSSNSLWRGPSGAGAPSGTLVIRDLLAGLTGPECDEIQSSLGPSWLGCLWGSPQATFSCTCPQVGDNFEAYLKHRLNVATFWKTPITAPVDRRKFLDAFKYQSKVDLTLAGDFKLRPGDVLEIQVDRATRTPYNSNSSIFSGLYFVLSVKHVVNAGGTHEMAVSVSQIPDK
jgi:hypothetical protein